MAEYRKTAFSMMYGEVEDVSIEFEKERIDIFRDKFGTDFKLFEAAQNNIISTVKVIPFNTFFGWCSTMGTRLKIIYPQSVADRYKEYLEEILEN